MSKADQDNRANQLNPNSDAFWQSRGSEERPEDWEERTERSEKGASQAGNKKG